MSRQRMVKPEFFDSESLAKCSMAARLAFIGLWVEADDFGHLKAQFGRLKARIFPFEKMSETKFISLLGELEEVGCIRGYEVEGERYIDIPHFSDYQYVKKPSKSMIPEYELGTSTPLVPHQYPTSTPPVEPKRKERKGIEKKEITDVISKKEKKEITTVISKKERVARFTPPSLDDVRSYVNEKGYTFDAEAFYAFYESKGWKVGNSPMKDWKAACATWQRREVKERGGEIHGKYAKYANAF